MQRVKFGSRLGAILAAAGSAVGLGNIWRFPCEAGAGGGAAFILVYIAFIAIVALPVLITEMALGRSARSNAFDTCRSQGKSPLWMVPGILCVLSGFLILSYYGVVAGWTLEYVWQSLTGSLAGRRPEQFGQDFQTFSSDALRPVLWMAVFVAITTFIVIAGVKKGIERGSKIMMPLLFILLVVLAVCSLSLPGAGRGVEFLLKPDFSKLTPGIMLSALGQAFFTMSLGIGCIMTYSSYFSEKVNLVKDASHVAVIDTLVAIMAGLIIFPAAMSVGINPDAGPSLVFITLPNVFQQAFGTMPVLCYVVTLMFYILLAMAALTSSISMLEITTAFVSERMGMKRWQAALALGLLTAVTGVACSLSFGPWKDVTLFGMGFFDLFDYFVAKISMPLGGIFFCQMLSRKCREGVRDILTNHGTLHLGRIPDIVHFMVKWVIPLLIVIIFINEEFG